MTSVTETTNYDKLTSHSDESQTQLINSNAETNEESINIKVIDTPKIENNNNDSTPFENDNKEIEQKPKKSKRIFWLDLLRIYASYLVVLTHTCGYSLKRDFKSSNWIVVSSYQGTSRACVPFFIMISGALFLNPKKKISYKKIYSRYVLRILKSFVFWSLFYTIVYRYFLNKKYTLDFLTKNIGDTFTTFLYGYGHLWYLNFVIGLYISTPIFKAITQDKTLTIYTTALFSLVTQLIPSICEVTQKVIGYEDINVLKNYVNKLLIEMAGSYSVYYLLGYLLDIYEIPKKIYLYLIYLIGILATALAPVLNYLRNRKVEKETTDMLSFNHFYVALSSAAGFLFFKYTVNRIIQPLTDKPWFIKVVTVLSDCSFGVYLLHLAMIRFYGMFLNLYATLYNPIYFAIIVSLIVYFSCFIIIFFLRKISIFKEIT